MTKLFKSREMCGLQRFDVENVMMSFYLRLIIHLQSSNFSFTFHTEELEDPLPPLSSAAEQRAESAERELGERGRLGGGMTATGTD